MAYIMVPKHRDDLFPEGIGRSGFPTNPAGGLDRKSSRPRIGRDLRLPIGEIALTSDEYMQFAHDGLVDEADDYASQLKYALGIEGRNESGGKVSKTTDETLLKVYSVGVPYLVRKAGTAHPMKVLFDVSSTSTEAGIVVRGQDLSYLIQNVGTWVRGDVHRVDEKDSRNITAELLNGRPVPGVELPTIDDYVANLRTSR